MRNSDFNRFDFDYKNRLLSLLDIEGEEGLINTAIPLAEPWKVNGQEYTKVCRIDFIGIAATTLFDVAGNLNKNSVAQRLEELCSELEYLNNKGIFLKIRILFWVVLNL